MITKRPAGGVFFSGPPGFFELLAVKVFWVIWWWQGGLHWENIKGGKKSAQPLIQLQSCHLSAKFQLKSKHVIREEEFFFFFFISLCKERAHLHLMLERAQPHVCDVNCFQLLVNKQLITTFTHVKWQLLVALEVITAAKEEFRQQSINSNRIQERDRTFIHRTTVQKSTVSCCN